MTAGKEKTGESVVDIIEKWVAGISLGIAAVLVFVAVILRVFFNYSISAFDELTRYLIIWSTFISASRLLHRNGHITIDVLMIHLPERTKLILQTFAYIMGAIFCALLMLNGLSLIQQSIAVDARSMSNLRMPMWIPQLAVPVGAMLMLLRFLEKIIGHFKQIRST